ncbi:MAG: cysteine peptidase family C39 domain-containing protein [Nanoarchaeota archaeon]
MQTPFHQRDGHCGPASLKIVLEEFGISATEKKIASLSRYTNIGGTTAQNLVKAAKVFGIKGIIKDNADLKDIKKYIDKNCEIIIEWFSEDDGHFSVITKIDKENVYLLDPELGHLRAMRNDIFKRVWFSFENKFMKSKDDLILRRMIIFSK